MAESENMFFKFQLLILGIGFLRSVREFWPLGFKFLKCERNSSSSKCKRKKCLRKISFSDYNLYESAGSSQIPPRQILLKRI